jgi:hypothetical protein
MKLKHMPWGCGTWPAYWMYGNGEIDILEGVDTMTKIASTLHTDTSGCDMSSQSTSLYSGTASSTNCWNYASGQYNFTGCSIKGPDGTYGGPVNDAGGGVFATEWTNDHIAMWHWTIDAAPSDIDAGNPDPTTWDLVSAALC